MNNMNNKIVRIEFSTTADIQKPLKLSEDELFVLYTYQRKLKSNRVMV